MNIYDFIRLIFRWEKERERIFMTDSANDSIGLRRVFFVYIYAAYFFIKKTRENRKRDKKIDVYIQEERDFVEIIA